MTDFADSIRSGREPRSRIQGRFYLRINDLEKKCSGFPEVGEKWKYLFNDLPKQIEP